MYSILFMSGSVNLSSTCCDKGERELTCTEKWKEMKIIFPLDEIAIVDTCDYVTGIYLNEKGYIEIDYYENSTKLLVDPDMYKLEVDYNKNTETLMIYIKMKEE